MATDKSFSVDHLLYCFLCGTKFLFVKLYHIPVDYDNPDEKKHWNELEKTGRVVYRPVSNRLCVLSAYAE